MSERNDLMRQLYNTDNEAKKDAIVKRLNALDKAQADKAAGQAMDALSWPQEQLKKRSPLTEDDREWFKQGNMPTPVYAGGNAALDVLADPLNAVGGGLWAKGASALNKMGKGAESAKGMLSANFNNYINDFYGTGGRESTMLEKAVGPMMQKVKPNIPDELAGDAAAKLIGTAKTVGKGALVAAKALVSPADRALWKDTGISKGGQNIIKEYVSDPKAKRAQSKAVAEANYQLHNAFQGGRKGDVHPALKGIGEKSNLETYTKNEPGTVEGWMNKHSGSRLDEATGEYVPITMNASEAKYIEDHVMRDWQGADGLVMKKPASKQSGDHRNDALSAKNPSVGGINRSFAALDKAGTPKTVEALEAELKVQQGVRQKAVDKDKKLSNYKIVGRDEDGVWLRTSKAGSAITEGGVNILTKVKTNGEYFSVVSDKHDFLEKFPGLGQATKVYLPNDLVAVTPPMYANVYKKPIKGGSAPYRLSSTELPKDPNATKWQDDLEAIATAQPDPRTVRAEEMKQAGLMTLGLSAEDKVNE